MTTKNVPLEPTEYMLIPYHLRERLSDALFMSEMCCDDIIEAVANAPLQASPRVVDDAMVQRLAIHMATKESAYCVTLDSAVNHVNNWKRLIPEATEALQAALEQT